MNQRTNVLAEGPEQGTLALASFASTLTEEEWQKRVPKDGRKVGVIVHHAATVYPLELHLAHTVAAGGAVQGVFQRDRVQIKSGRWATDCPK